MHLAGVPKHAKYYYVSVTVDIFNIVTLDDIEKKIENIFVIFFTASQFLH